MVAVEWFEGSRTELDDLFALADDSPMQVARYRDQGRILVARDGPVVAGHLQLVEVDDENAEIKSIAVREDRQGAGLGRLLVERALTVARAEGRSTLVVATAAADTGVLRFYQRLGFRFVRVERDVFTSGAGYPPVEVDGIAIRDQVWLALTVREERGQRPEVHPMQLRVARHTDRLDELVRFYRDGLGLVEIGGFRDHDGYDGAFLEVPGSGAHLEFTSGGGHRPPDPHPESLLVLYLGDAEVVARIAARLGQQPAVPANPYWREHATAFVDPDGFQVLLVPETWGPDSA